LLYEAGSIRSLKVGADEIVRRIYFALRDRNWNTIAGRIGEEEIKVSDDEFVVSFVSAHESGPVRFHWRGEIRGGRDGRVSFVMDGTSVSSFQRNRVGLCVLHPMEIAGRSCTITHSDGTVETAAFPSLISPHQPFFAIRALEYSPSTRTSVSVEFEGDVFEMEDQRNWTDASFKTYSTPLDLPFPVELRAGTKIRQTVTVSPSVAGGGQTLRRSRPVAKTGIALRVDRNREFRVPDLGFVWQPFPSADPSPLLDRIRAVRPDFLRCDMHPGIETVSEICASLESAGNVGVLLELGLFMGNDEEADLLRVRRALEKARPAVKRILVFREGSKSTPAASLRSANEALKPSCPGVEFCAGTDAFFAELNRDRPDMSLADGMTFSINPQVHVFDNASLVESLDAQRVTIETAKTFAAAKPIHVSPVSFKMRWNPNATGGEENAAEKGGLSFVDPRQLSLFGAAWTAGSIHSLGLGGADSVTYFETIGARGIMEQDQPVLSPAFFPSLPHGVFPLYFVFLGLAPYKGGRAVHVQSDDPLMVDAFAVKKNGRLLYVVSNYADEEETVLLYDVGGEAGIRYLDIESYEMNATRPEECFGTSARGRTAGGRLQLTLPPSGMAFVTL
jgi:hypothetical protein